MEELPSYQPDQKQFQTPVNLWSQNLNNILWEGVVPLEIERVFALNDPTLRDRIVKTTPYHTQVSMLHLRLEDIRDIAYAISEGVKVDATHFEKIIPIVNPDSYSLLVPLSFSYLLDLSKRAKVRLDINPYIKLTTELVPKVYSENEKDSYQYFGNAFSRTASRFQNMDLKKFEGK